MLKALYDMLISAVLFYKKFRQNIKEIVFEINSYEICVANLIVNGEQQTLTWHVDDIMLSHVNPQLNDKFLEWL